MTPAVRSLLFDSWRRGAGVALDFVNDRYSQQGVGSGIGLISVSRASTGTDLLPSSPSGAPYLTFAANTPRRSGALGGLLVEGARTQLSAFPTAPQNETITIGSTGTYTLWVNGSGSAAVAAGTAVGSGFGTATNGAPVVFTISSTGTVGITVTGSLQALQVEAGAFGTSFIPQAATVRAQDTAILGAMPTLGGAYTLAASGVTYAPAGGAEAMATLADSIGAERLQLSRFNGFSAFTLRSGAVNSYAVFAAAITTGVVCKMAMAARAGAQESSIDGGLVSPGTGSPMPAPTGLYIGTTFSINPWNGVIRSVFLWPTTFLPASDLQRITTP